MTANVTEGQIFTISDIKLSGSLVLAEEDMAKLITAKPGEVFSRKKLEKSAQQMTAVLANIGYAFAQVTPIPTVDREKRLVSINSSSIPASASMCATSTSRAITARRTK